MKQLSIFLIMMLVCISPAFAGDQLVVHFVNVGQGDSIFVQAPGGKTMLIDAGEDNKLSEQYLDSLGVKTINCLVATHPHLDHIGGLVSIMKKYDVRSVIMPRVADVTTVTYQKLLEAVRDKGLRITEGKAGVVIDLDPAVTTEILAPNSTGYKDVNDYSVVIKMTYHGVSFLFTGDATAVSEAEMLKNSPDKLKSTVLKVPHHGSTSSSSAAFIREVNPVVSVFMVGRNNNYGHPTKTVLSRVAKSQIFRTDEQGTIVLATDGKALTYSTERKTVAQNEPPATSPAPATPPPLTWNQPVPSAAGQQPRAASTDVVYVTNTGDKYHKAGCRYLKSSSIPISRTEAVKKYSPCSVCKP